LKRKSEGEWKKKVWRGFKRMRDGEGKERRSRRRRRKKEKKKEEGEE
jgi:hypothetical protein